MKIRLEHDGSLLDVDEDDIEKVKWRNGLNFALLGIQTSSSISSSNAVRLHKIRRYLLYLD